MDHMKSMSFEVKERKNKKKELFFVRQICFDDDIFGKKKKSLHLHCILRTKQIERISSVEEGEE